MATDILPNTADIERLLRDPTAGTRRSLAEKLGLSYARALFKPRERKIADDILRAIARDVEVSVRQALAQTIATSPDLPEDVAIRLANDVIDVAEPILTKSDILNDAELIRVVAERSEAHRVAVAERESLSEPVSDAIIDHGAAPSIGVLSGNPGAAISEDALGKVVSDFGGDKAISAAIAARDALPLGIAERLVGLVSERLKLRFGSGEKARKYADALAAGAAGGAALLLGGDDTDTLDMLAMVDQLKATGKLQPTLVLRAGRAGEAELMCAAISRLNGEKYSDVCTKMNSAELARPMLYDVGLIPIEVDDLLTASGLCPDDIGQVA